jgi:hypothetical protein
MGYYIEMDITNLLIKQANIKPCLAAINALFPVSENSRYHYAWVNNPPTGSFNTLTEALDEWRYKTEENNDDIAVTNFTGEKLGDDEILYKAIAPFIESSAKIVITGEDDCKWEYIFTNGTYTKTSIGKQEYNGF